MSDDEQALLNTILAHPEADLPRLVYADWLEGDADPPRPERAEFIRVQCELARHPDDVDWLRNMPVESFTGPAGKKQHLVDIAAMMAREQQLLAEFGPRWYEEFGRSITGGTECAAWSVEGPQPSGWMVFGGGWAAQREPFVKGFVGRVAGTLAWLLGGPAVCPACSRVGAYMYCEACEGTGYSDTGRTPGHLAGLVRKWPITTVVATDREPYQPAEDSFAWVAEDAPVFVHGSDIIPTAVFDRLTGWIEDQAVPERMCEYPTLEAAFAALSDAILAVARAEPVEAR